MDVVKERIISKSLELFTQIGVKVITMDMICEELGMSKKTLYEHFSSKEDLIKQAFNEQFHETSEDLNTKIFHFSNPIHQLSFIFEHADSFYFIKEGKASFQLQKFYPEIYSEILEVQNVFIKNILEKNILLGISDGLYRSKLNTDFVVEYISIILNNTYNFENDEAAIKRQNYFFELLLRSITTKKGLKDL